MFWNDFFLKMFFISVATKHLQYIPAYNVVLRYKKITCSKITGAHHTPIIKMKKYKEKDKEKVLSCHKQCIFRLLQWINWKGNVHRFYSVKWGKMEQKSNGVTSIFILYWWNQRYTLKLEAIYINKKAL